MSRMNGPTRKKKYKHVAKRDGEHCRRCGALHTEKQLVLDHKDNNNNNNDVDNLQLLCRSCNYLKNPRRPLDLSESEFVSEMDLSEIEINRTKEPLFKKFVCHELNELGEVPENGLNYSASEDIGISPVTAKRYLNKMCSSRGILERVIRAKTVFVRYKKEIPFVLKNQVCT